MPKLEEKKLTKKEKEMIELAKKIKNSSGESKKHYYERYYQLKISYYKNKLKQVQQKIEKLGKMER